MNYSPINPKKFLHNLHPDFIKIVILRTIGNFLILMSIFIMIRTFQKPVMEEARFLLDSYNKRHYALSEDTQNLVFNKNYKLDKKTGTYINILDKSTIQIIRPVDPQYSIVIPKINANAKVIPNVDTSDRVEYLNALQKGVAHAEGTANPGEGGHMFYFAHSTDNFWNVTLYNAVFYLLYKLERGDEVDIYYKGVRYKYIVTGYTIVNPNEVKYLTKKTRSDYVTLQTCWPLGTTWKRYLVFAKPK
jgi:LPXTG-site transpeptidase (sortase) family protein